MFLHQVSNHVNSSTSEPAQILIVLAKKGFVDIASILRKLSQTVASVRRGRFTDEAKTESLELLRGTYENQRKAFMFALINSSEGLHTAAAVIEAGPVGMLSKKESKKLAQLKKFNKERKFQFRKNTSTADKSRSVCFFCGQVRLYYIINLIIN